MDNLMENVLRELFAGNVKALSFKHSTLDENKQLKYISKFFRRETLRTKQTIRKLRKF